MVRRSLDQLDQEVVSKTGDETIAWLKTFTGNIILNKHVAIGTAINANLALILKQDIDSSTGGLEHQ